MNSATRDTVSGYLQAATIGMASVIALYFAGSVSSVEPEIFPALILYFSALVYPRFQHALALLIFLVVALFFNHLEPTFGMLRVTVFALVLSFSGSKRFGFSPAILLGALWELTLLAPTLSVGYVVPPFDAALVSTMVTEIVGLVIVWFIAASPPIRALCPAPRLKQRHLFVHLLMIPLFTVPAATLYLISFWSGLSPNALMLKYHLVQEPIIFGWFSLMLAGMLLTALIASIIVESIDTYILAATPLPLAGGEQAYSSVFSDAQDVLTRLRHDADELIALRRIFGEMQTGLEVELPNLAQTYRALEKSSEVLSHAPDGCIAIIPGGQVVSASAGLERLLSLPKAVRIGDHLEDISTGNSKWAADVLTIVRWAIDHYEELLKRGTRDTQTQTVNGDYLEVTIKAWRFGAHFKDRKGPVIVAAYLRRRKDRREMQLQLLQPGEFERIGSAANELLQSLEDHIAAVNEPLSLLVTKFQNGLDAAGRPLGSSAAGGEISQLLMEVVKVFRRFTSEIEEQGRNVQALRSTVEKVDLGAALEQTTNYLLELLGSERRIRFSRGGGNGTSTESAASTQAITVRLPLAEIFGFLNYYTLFLRYVIPLARDFSLQLDYEQIGTRTASLLSGSIPGRYARLTLRHSGQSITSNVLSAQQDPTYVLNAESTDSIGSALYFLTRQVKRLGGFASIQSSPAKGTDVSIYLPVEIGSPNRLSKRELKKIASTLGTGVASSATQVLIVSNNETSAAHLSGLIDDMALQPIVRKPAELLRDMVTPLEFDGTGFGGESGAGIDLGSNGETLSIEPRQRIDFSPFSLLIFDNAIADFGTLTLIDELEKENPSVAKILLLDQDDTEKSQALSNWITVFKPIEDMALCEKIHDALKNAIRIQESLVVIEGNDSLRGSGFS
ncbi:MAG: hypothetical protein U0136_02810 [Bdellovibrionota bacterium]